jgi:hypothetical protein
MKRLIKKMMLCAALTVQCMLSGAQSPYIYKVYDFMPAPGQFTIMLPTYEPGDTRQDMIRKAEECIANNGRYEISLGGYGGYVVFGFDHLVENKQPVLHPSNTYLNDIEYIRRTTNGHGDGFLFRNVYHNQSYYPQWITDETIWCYTGYLYEEVLSNSKRAQILPYIDVLVDGPYMEKLRNESLRFRGRSNQRIIEV